MEVFAVDGERDLARILDERQAQGEVRVQRRMGAPAVWLVKVREEER